MIVAVITMRVVKMSVDEVINVVAVWNWFVPTPRTMNMIRIMATALMGWCAGVRIGFAHFDFVFDNRSVLSHVVQVTVMQVVNMPVVLDTGVFAVRPVLVIMIFVCMAHRCLRGEQVSRL